MCVYQAAEVAWNWACERLKAIKPLHTPTYAPGSWLEVISDASKFGWGGILIEWREGDPKPYIVACVSGTFTPSQLAWPTCTKEMFGVWSTVRKLRHFLHLHHFVLSTDHRNLLCKWWKPAPRYDIVWDWIQKFSRLAQNRCDVIVTRSCVTLRVRKGCFVGHADSVAMLLLPVNPNPCCWC